MKTIQPNSKMCFICGLENPVGLHLHIYETEPGVVETNYTAPDHFQGYPGVLHGGIIAALIDELGGRAHMGSDPQNPRFMFTAKLEVKYRKNVPIGRPLKVIGRAGRSKTRSAEAWAGIYDADTNDLLA
ncbi:MAG: PaaI family thioesterase, partial [Anaerolineales bacterium]|nr:PaaI family thioesterase [Anaerolineales bacterium]